MDKSRVEKKFPAYMESIRIPECAKEQDILVYRACPTYKIEKASFLNSYEENGFKTLANSEDTDPQQYCLSTFQKVKDVKRFCAIDAKYQPPLPLAKGVTSGKCGVSCITKQWKKTKNSHVDWWLYSGAEPWKFFEEVNYEDEIKSNI